MTANGITLLSPDGLVASPAVSHVAVVPPGATTIYVGGQNGVDAAGALVGDDPGEQTRRTMDNLVTALESAGAGLADVVSMTVLLKEASTCERRTPWRRNGSPTCSRRRWSLQRSSARSAYPVRWSRWEPSPP
jgi:enamine deaminase RidA (YjgF/YER057c/UK114 family)